ncbi:MAG: hypothetical protein ACFE8A_08775 [Candidatus Hodarchaeota archaeon]
MEVINLKVFRLNYSGNFEEISIETSQDLLNLFTLFDILAIYIPIQKRMYVWIGKNVTQTLRNYIPEIRTRFSEKLPVHLRILRNITIESGSEPSDFFQFLDLDWEELNAHIKEQELKLEPLLKEIKSLKKELTSLVERELYDDCIKISEKIIELAKKTIDSALEREQEDFIKEIKEKYKIKANAETVEEDTTEIKKEFDELIKTNNPKDILKAHNIIEEFKKKYEKIIDLTSIPSTNELLARDENLWYNFKRKQQKFSKELDQLEIKLKTAMKKFEISDVEETMMKAEDLLLRVIDEVVKKNWSKIEIDYAEWKRKNVTIKEIEESLEESTKLKESFQFEEAISRLNSTMEFVQDKEILEYSKKLQEKRKEVIKAEMEYIKVRERIAVLVEKIKEGIKNDFLNAALINCEKIIQLAESIKKHDSVVEYNQILEEIKEELDKRKVNIQNEQIELTKKAKDLEKIIVVDNENVLPLVEEFAVNEILGDLSDDVSKILDQLGNLLIEHRVDIKKEISNRALLTSASGDVVEYEKKFEVQKIEEKDEMVKYSVKSSIINPFKDSVKDAIITDLIPYNFEITDMQLNGKPVKKLPDKSLTKEGLELKWQIQNIPLKEKVEIDYSLRRRVSRTIIFVFKENIKIIKIHSNLNKLEKLEGLYEAVLPFTNSYGSVLDGVIVEDVIPLYYLYFIKEPTHLLPAEITSSEYGELVKWNIGTMKMEALNYQYRLLEQYKLEKIKINVIDLGKNGILALSQGDLTEALMIYDNIIDQLEEYNK